MLFTGLGESFDPVLFGLSRTLNKASDWTYEVIFNAIQKETDRQGSTEWQTTALNTSFTGFSSRGGGQKGRSRGGKPKSVEVQEKPKGKEGEKETVVAKDGSRWTKGDMWCENNANHSTKGCIAAARKDQRKEWGQSQANVASLDPFDDIDSDRDKVFPPTLAIQPTIRRAGASNVVVEPEAITSILSSALLADRDNKLVLDSGATDTFVNGISFLHDPRPCRRTVRVGNNDVIHSTHIGSVHIQLDNISSPIILPNALVVPLLGHNLISAASLTRADCFITFHPPTSCTITTKTGDAVKVPRVDGLHVLPGHPLPVSNLFMLLSHKPHDLTC
jgi:hypothetical protein